MRLLIAAVLSTLITVPALVDQVDRSVEPAASGGHDLVILSERIVEPRATSLSFGLVVPEAASAVRVELDWHAGTSLPVLLHGPGSCDGYVGPDDADAPAGPADYVLPCFAWERGGQELTLQTRGALLAGLRVIATLD